MQKGYRVHILDEFSTRDYFRALGRAAARADVIGISCFTGYQIDSAVRTARYLRAHFPRIPLVWGGYHPSLYPEATLQSGYADYVIPGQGEWIFLEFVQRLFENAEPEKTPGIYRKENGRIVYNTGAVAWHDLEAFPPFPYELVPLRAFLINSLTPRSISYHSSMGCPYRCNFCTVMQIYNRRWSGFPPERVLSDVRYLLHKTGAQSIEFYDNNFFVNDDRVFRIARSFLDHRLGILWSAEARPDKIAAYDDEMLSLLKRSGLKWVFIGAESGHDGVLTMMERDHTVSDILQAAENLARHQIQVTFSFNLGYPGEPADNFARTEALAKELLRINPETELMIYITTVYEPTPSFHRARELMDKTTESLEQWAHLDQRSGEQKSWLTPAYSRKLHHFSLVTFYATSFMLARQPQNPVLRWLRRLAAVHLKRSWYRTILDLRVLNKIRTLLSRRNRKRHIDMWSGRS